MTAQVGIEQITAMAFVAWDVWQLEAVVERLQKENPIVVHRGPVGREEIPDTAAAPEAAERSQAPC